METVFSGDVLNFYGYGDFVACFVGFGSGDNEIELRIFVSCAESFLESGFDVFLDGGFFFVVACAFRACGPDFYFAEEGPGAVDKSDLNKLTGSVEFEFCAIENNSGVLGGSYSCNCIAPVFAVVGNVYFECFGSADALTETAVTEPYNYLAEISGFAEIEGEPVVAEAILNGRSNAGPACPFSSSVFCVCSRKNAVVHGAAVFIGICDRSVFVPAPVYFLAALTELFGSGVGSVECDVNAFNNGFAVFNADGGNVSFGSVLNGSGGLVFGKSNLIANLECHCSYLGGPVIVLNCVVFDDCVRSRGVNDHNDVTVFKVDALFNCCSSRAGGNNGSKRYFVNVCFFGGSEENGDSPVGVSCRIRISVIDNGDIFANDFAVYVVNFEYVTVCVIKSPVFEILFIETLNLIVFPVDSRNRNCEYCRNEKSRKKNC